MLDLEPCCTLCLCQTPVLGDENVVCKDPWLQQAPDEKEDLSCDGFVEHLPKASLAPRTLSIYQSPVFPFMFLFFSFRLLVPLSATGSFQTNTTVTFFMWSYRVGAENSWCPARLSLLLRVIGTTQRLNLQIWGSSLIICIGPMWRAWKDP